VRVLAGVAVLALAAGCLRASRYECSTNEQCVAGGLDGFCEPTDDARHFCAFPDETCAPSGLRFGASAEASAGACAGGVTAAGRNADVCLAGAKFPVEFSACTQTVCARLPTCCGASWGPLCVSEADLLCGAGCGRQLAFAGKGAVDVVADDDRDGTFTVATTIGAAAQFYARVQWADLDGDATPELVVATSNLGDAGDEQWIDHYDGTTLSTVVDVRSVMKAGRTPWVRFSALAISIGDYDRDGYADLAWFGTYPAFLIAHNRKALQLELGPEGSMGPPDVVNPIADGVGWGDVDGDGDDDLALMFDNNLWVLRSDHDQLVPAWNVALPDRPYWGAWGDVDGDGKLDLAIAGNGFARIFRNAGTELDKTPVWMLDGPQYYGGTWIDVDRDGDLDVVVSENQGKLRLYLNDAGVMQTKPAWSSLEDQETPTVVAADVDGDGDLDLVVANHQPFPSRIYLNDGDQTFSVGSLSLPAISFEGVSATARTIR
jgi:hypothetical protein